MDSEGNEASEGSSSSSSSSEPNRRLEDEPWFHGFLPKDELERLFHDDGDFAVRLSLDERAALLLSVQHKKQIKAFHINESKGNGTVYVEKKEFEMVSDLITFHRLARVPVTEGSGVYLVRPILNQKWELDNDTLTRKNKLGGGEYGKVWKGVWRLKTDRDIVVAFKESLERDVPAKLELLAEARTILAVQTPTVHPNIVRCHGIAVKKDPIYLVMEYCQEGTLLQFLKSANKKMSEKLKLKFCRELVQALKHLEDKKCVHRDVAARNILLHKGYTVKLSDFGLATLGSHPAKKDKKIPIKWSAPEAVIKDEFTHKSDIWSLGVTVWEIFTGGEEPWPGKSMDGVRKELQAGRSMELPKNAPGTVQEWLRKLWNPDPTKRPSAKAIKF